MFNLLFYYAQRVIIINQETIYDYKCMIINQKILRDIVNSKLNLRLKFN